MIIKCLCELCRKEYEVSHWRKEKTHFCSKECSAKSKLVLHDLVCEFCKKPFKAHTRALRNKNRPMGHFCSRNCTDKMRVTYFKGENNHQYGLKGDKNASFSGMETKRKNHKNNDIHIYIPEHPYANKSGRVLKHKFIVEENYLLFDSKFFVKIGDKFYLNKKYDVHHIDLNHDNNNVDNLLPLTRSEHSILHNKTKVIIRGDKGRIIGTKKL